MKPNCTRRDFLAAGLALLAAGLRAFATKRLCNDALGAHS